MKLHALRFDFRPTRFDGLTSASGAINGNRITTEGMAAQVNLAHARFMARATGGMWTWDGDTLIRVNAPDAPQAESRAALVKRMADKLNPDGGPDLELCCITGCERVRGRHRIICRNHLQQWTDAGKPPMHIWLPAKIATSKTNRKAV